MKPTPRGGLEGGIWADELEADVSVECGERCKKARPGVVITVEATVVRASPQLVLHHICTVLSTPISDSKNLTMSSGNPCLRDWAGSSVTALDPIRQGR